MQMPALHYRGTQPVGRLPHTLWQKVHLVLWLHGGMQIFEKTPTGKIIKFVVEASNLVVYTVIQNNEEIPLEQECLIFAGKQLEDDHTL